MQKIGEVELILNQKFALIKTTEPIILGSEVLIYVEKEIPNTQDKIEIPKGKLKVVMIQGENRYLVSVISKKIEDQNQSNVALARSLSMFGNIVDNTKPEVANGEESATYSAQLDSSVAVGLDINPLVKPGDLVSIG